MDLLRRLVELERKATPGPWHDMDKLPKSFDDHGYRRVAELMYGRRIYAESSNMIQEGKGCVWGEDGPLIEALRNNLPEILRALAVAQAVQELRYEYEEQQSDTRVVLAEPSVYNVMQRSDEILAETNQRGSE